MKDFKDRSVSFIKKDGKCAKNDSLMVVEDPRLEAEYDKKMKFSAVVFVEKKTVQAYPTNWKTKNSNKKGSGVQTHTRDETDGRWARNRVKASKQVKVEKPTHTQWIKWRVWK